jgi:hypothetical protein
VLWRLVGASRKTQVTVAVCDRTRPRLLADIMTVAGHHDISNTVEGPWTDCIDYRLLVIIT